jgi:hypothetical protein
VLQAHSSIGNLPTATTQNRIRSLAAYALADQSDGTQASQADPLTVLVIEPRRLAKSHLRNRERCSLEITVFGGTKLNRHWRIAQR